jgi:hypothetical protein
LAADTIGGNVAIIDDMLTDRVALDFTHRGQPYRIYYKPLAIDDAVKLKLDDAVAKFDARSTGDFTGVNPLLLDILADWEFDRIRRDQDGRPLSADGSILVDRNTQAPALERLPITEDTIARMPVFLKLEMATAIIQDIQLSPGNTTGTSATTQPAALSAGATGVPTNGAGLTSVPFQSTANGQTMTVPPALVTVPSLESRESTT